MVLHVYDSTEALRSLRWKMIHINSIRVPHHESTGVVHRRHHTSLLQTANIHAHHRFGCFPAGSIGTSTGFQVHCSCKLMPDYTPFAPHKWTKRTESHPDLDRCDHVSRQFPMKNDPAGLHDGTAMPHECSLMCMVSTISTAHSSWASILLHAGVPPR